MARAIQLPNALSSPAKSFGRVPFAFGPRFFTLILLGLVALIPAWFFPRAILLMFVWDGIVLAIWVWDISQLPHPRQMEVRRNWSASPALSVPSEIQVEVRNQGACSVRVTAIDETPINLRPSPPTLGINAAPGRKGSAKYPILPSIRGEAHLGKVFVRYRSALGIAERWAVADLQQKVCVLPDIEAAKKHTLFLIRSRQVEMERRMRRHRGLGREFESLREYRRGDDFRDISWTATARRHELITRTFELERGQIVWIVIDAGRLLRAQIEQPRQVLRLSKLDYSVNAALSLAQVALYSGDRVGLVAYGRRIQQNLNASRGSSHLRNIVESLSYIHSEAAEADHLRAAQELLTAQKRRSLVVWITDFAEAAMVPEVIESTLQVTKRHLVIFAAMGQPDLNLAAQTTPQSKEEMYRHATAVEIFERREVLMSRLRQSGVLTLEFMPNMMATALVNQYLEVKERNLL
jgi:uncharacterized protein (DUF58 family)